ncbi:MAG: alanine racemase [Eubacteriaceae bacterium]|nr:alanine racemase [Eubacteriaceae bacterium]
MNYNDDLRDTEIIVDLGKLGKNIRNIKKLIGPEVALLIVVKANAYGHGAPHIVETLMKNGADYLAVATLSEAMELRDYHKDSPILIMGHTPDRYLHYAVDNDITLTVFSDRQAHLLNQIAEERGKIAKVHIKIDTGFHRLGLNGADREATVDAVSDICSLKNIYAEGIFSHLALAGEEDDEKQYRLLVSVIDRLKSRGITFRYSHIADSIATVDYPQYRMNMVRVGALAYGMIGFTTGHVEVEQIMTFRTRISQLHHIKKGDGVSYDYLWKAERDSVVATLPFGYADGYPRNMRDKGYVTIKGIKCPLVGVLCMDQVIADVTEVPNVSEGDMAIIYGSGKNEMTIQEASQLAETNKNEIIARLLHRPPRKYI